MQNRRGFFKTLAGIVVGGAGAAVVGPTLKLQNKPGPAISSLYGIHEFVNDGLVTHWNGIIRVPNPRQSVRIYGIGA